MKAQRGALMGFSRFPKGLNDARESNPSKLMMGYVLRREAAVRLYWSGCCFAARY